VPEKFVVTGPSSELLALPAGELVLPTGSGMLSYVLVNGSPTRPPIGKADSRIDIPADAGSGSYYLIGTELVRVDSTGPQVVVTPAGDGLPSPYAEVTVEVDVAGARTVTLFRREGRRTHRVRGFVQRSTTSVLTVRDYEAPLGRPLDYFAEVADRTGTVLHRTEPVTVELPSPLRRSAIVHDVLNPAGAVTVTLAASALESLARALSVSTIATPGRSAPAVLGGTRGALAGLALDCYTDTAEAADKLWSALGGYDSDTAATLCIRLSPDAPLPGTLYVTVPAPEARPIDAAGGGETVAWKLTADEVTPPTPALSTPVFTYADLTTALGAYRESYADFASAYRRYRDATLDVKVGPWA